MDSHYTRLAGRAPNNLLRQERSCAQNQSNIISRLVFRFPAILNETDVKTLHDQV